MTLISRPGAVGIGGALGVGVGDGDGDGVGGKVGGGGSVITGVAVGVAGADGLELAVGSRLVVGNGLKLKVGTEDTLGLTRAKPDGDGLTRGPGAGLLSRMKITAPTRTISTKPRPAATSCAFRAFML
jgi:hypothetical protein